MATTIIPLFGGVSATDTAQRPAWHRHFASVDSSHCKRLQQSGRKPLLFHSILGIFPAVKFPGIYGSFHPCPLG